MHSEFIAAGEFCAFHHVELSFIKGLQESGLIGITVRDGAIMLSTDDLPALEKFARWHYELAVNFEGIEALAHLLHRVDNLQEENRGLRNRLRCFDNMASSGSQPAEEI
jgi:hypothetical protein